jgi:hypothetical protein
MGEQSSLLMRIAMTESVSLCTRMKSWPLCGTGIGDSRRQSINLMGLSCDETLIGGLRSPTPG